MTNYESITTMNVDELAEYLCMEYINDCDRCPCDEYNHRECYGSNVDCVELIKKWLGLEVKK